MSLIRLNNPGKQPLTGEANRLIRMDSQGKQLQTKDTNHLIRMDSKGNLIGGASRQVQSTPQAFKSALLLLDASGSMADGSKFRYAQNGTMRFATSALEKGYRSGLIVFGNEARLIAAPTGDLKSFKDYLYSTRVSMLGGGTNMAHALYLAATVVGVAAVVVVTDGYPDHADEAIYYAGELRKRSIDIIAIGTEDADHDFLSRIATRNDLAIHTQTSNIQNAISDASRLLAC